MFVRNFVAIMSLAFACSMMAAGQETRCEMKLAQLKPAQELYGFRIGMTEDQVKAIVPSLETGRVDDLGFSSTSISPDFNPRIAKSAYAGVRTISLEFLDGRLFTLWIGFNSSFKWKALDEFVPGMGAALGLPAEAWSLSAQKASAECNEFEVSAAMIAGAPSVRIVDKAAKETWEQRRAEKAEKSDGQDSGEP